MRNKTCFAFPSTALFVIGSTFLLAIPPLGVVLLVAAMAVQISHMRRRLEIDREAARRRDARYLQARGDAARSFL